MPVIGPTRFTWIPNPESNLAGYKLYVGRQSGVYTQPGSPVTLGDVTEYSYSVGQAGRWYFALTAYNTLAQESGFSAELQADFTDPQVVVFMIHRT